MKKTILAVLLCLSLLAGCSGAPAPLPEAEQPDSSPVIAYVPLDDRPDNVGRVEYLAESLGYTLHMPGGVDVQDALDGPDRGLLRGKWSGDQKLDRTERLSRAAEPLGAGAGGPQAATVDILSMDQLLYGGLVASGWRKHPQSRTARLWLCRIFWKACCRRWLPTPITRSGYWTA